MKEELGMKTSVETAILANNRNGWRGKKNYWPNSPPGEIKLSQVN